MNGVTDDFAQAPSLFNLIRLETAQKFVIMVAD